MYALHSQLCRVRTPATCSCMTAYGQFRDSPHGLVGDALAVLHSEQVVVGLHLLAPSTFHLTCVSQGVCECNDMCGWKRVTHLQPPTPGPFLAVADCSGAQGTAAGSPCAHDAQVVHA